MEFSDLWDGVEVLLGAGFYDNDENFESKYLGALEETTQNFDLVWKVAGLQKDYSYKVEVKLENELLNLSRDIGALNFEYNELWNCVSTTAGIDIFYSDTNVETTYDELLYDLTFKSISKKVYVQGKYLNCSEFEDAFKEAVGLVKDSNFQVPLKSSKKCDQSKKNVSQNLKNLLEQRQKRLKLEDDTIECKRVDSEVSLVFSCKICGQESKRKRRLFVSHVLPKHIKAESKIKKMKRTSKVKQKLSFKSEIKKDFICPDLYCDKKFATRFNRKRHLVLKHNISDKNRRFKCEACSDEFSTRYNLMRHAHQSHRTPAELKRCPLCDYVTKRSFNFERHCLRKHEDLLDKVGYSKCEKCDKVFASQSLLNTHMEKHEVISIGYNCTLCKKKVEESHICEFFCEICPRRFESLVLYQRHKKIHKKFKDFVEYIENTADHIELKSQITQITF